MKRTTLPLAAISLLIILLWAINQTGEVLSFSAPFMTMRKTLTSLSGALALGWMGFTMLLALRPAWLEKALGGLDKLYATHKWAGIGSVLLVATHWLLILSPRTLMSWGWIETMARKNHGSRPEGQSLTGLAKEMGEWAAWTMIVIGIVALLRFIPYNWFRKLHKAFPVAFLIGAFHSIVLVPDELKATPFGALIYVASIAGSLIAIMSLTGMIGRSQRHRGKIASSAVTEAGVLDLEISPDPSWPGHQAGQFALLTFEAKEGAHPFSIVSSWQRGAQLRFAIKPLGDYTRALPRRIKAGDTVVIEGPFGRFDFGEIGESHERQVWVAGGIGIAPFIARLETLAATGGAHGRVHFFYSARTVRDATFPTGLEDLCWRAGVELHLRVDEKDAPFGNDEITSFVRGAKGVWFCGPSAWAKSLQRALQRNAGLPVNRFHSEYFEFR